MRMISVCVRVLFLKLRRKNSAGRMRAEMGKRGEKATSFRELIFAHTLVQLAAGKPSAPLSKPPFKMLMEEHVCCWPVEQQLEEKDEKFGMDKEFLKEPALRWEDRAEHSQNRSSEFWRIRCCACHAVAMHASNTQAHALHSQVSGG